MGKILIIEDEDLIREELEILLSNEGYRVESAAEFHHVTDLVKSFCPDLILLDINLPDENGLMLTRALRERSTVGIILVTGRSDRIDRIVGLEMGADYVYNRP